MNQEYSNNNVFDSEVPVSNGKCYWGISIT